MATQEKNEPEISIRYLSRGGLIAETPEHRIQIGSYPETIKDTITEQSGVPQTFVLPDILFDTDSGVSAADLEFPLYYHFFLKNQRIKIILHRRQLRPLIKLLQEAVFGPRKLDLTSDFHSSTSKQKVPDLAKEIAYYKLDPTLPRGRQRLRDMVEFYFFDDQNKIKLADTTLVSLGNNSYRLEGPNYTKDISLSNLNQRQGETAHGNRAKRFTPPDFGITIIGSGHGFDAQSKTSGFILWIQGKGILVDPPVHTTLWLEQQGIDSRLIGNIILTHCHSDHDSGTLQKVFQEGRVRIHTTPTIIKSFTAKYCSLLELKATELGALFEYCPVTVNSPVSLLGAKFDFHYTLHPIPTIGFQVQFGLKSFYYSCDTLYEPDMLKELCQKGILSNERYAQLTTIPWDSDLILHEAGIPPIHTPTSVLAKLSKEIKSRLFLTHISQSAIPQESGLVLARPGAENTIAIPCSPPDQNKLWQIVEAISNVEAFSELDLERVTSCLSTASVRKYAPGEIVINKNTRGGEFFIVLDGLVEIISESLPHPIRASRYDYFGETSILTGHPRNADAIARVESTLICIGEVDFKRLINNTNIAKTLTQLASNRASGARWLFEKSSTLSSLTPLQKNSLMRRMTSDIVPAGTLLFESGAEVDRFYLIDSGQVKIEMNEQSLTLGPGEFLGSFSANLQPAKHSLTATALTDLWVYTLSARDVEEFFRLNPGTFVKLYRRQCDTLSRLKPAAKQPLGA